jgi:hypothetical protein
MAGGREAEDLLMSAIEAARVGHHPRLAARVSHVLGVWRARQGEWTEAQQWLGDAERLFTTQENEPDRVATMLSGAQLLRAMGKRDAAHAQFDQVAQRARELDVRWLELAAASGAALSNGGPESGGSRARWHRVSELIERAPTAWWFPGRELVDAFAIQMLLQAGEPGAAQELFGQATTHLDRMDQFGSVWLVAECSHPMERAGVPAARHARQLARERTRQAGFSALEASLAD